MGALFAALLLAAAADARPSQKVSRDPRTMGLGKSCRKNADCKHRAQRCVHKSDMKGKPLDKGFCVLPCTSSESGTQKVSPAAPVDVARKARNPPPRCRVNDECRSAA